MAKIKKDNKGEIYTTRIIDMPKETRENLIYNERDEYLNLLYYALKLTRTDGAPVEYRKANFFKRAIIKRNKVGYRAAVDMFTYVTPHEVDNYGFPKEINMYTAREKAFPAAKPDIAPDPNGKYIIYGLPYDETTLYDMIYDGTNRLTVADNGIRQNFNASRNSSIIICKDKNTKLSLAEAIEEWQEGKPATIVSEELGKSIEVVSLASPFIVNEQQEYRNEIQDHLFNKIGIMSANTDKRERVQSSEVTATVGRCIDYINLIIENINDQFKQYGIPYKLENNTSTALIYSDLLNSDEPTEEEEKESAKDDIME